MSLSKTEPQVVKHWLWLLVWKLNVWCEIRTYILSNTSMMGVHYDWKETGRQSQQTMKIINGYIFVKDSEIISFPFLMLASCLAVIMFLCLQSVSFLTRHNSIHLHKGAHSHWKVSQTGPTPQLPSLSLGFCASSHHRDSQIILLLKCLGTLPFPRVSDINPGAQLC